MTPEQRRRIAEHLDAAFYGPDLKDRSLAQDDWTDEEWKQNEHELWWTSVINVIEQALEES